MKLSEQIKTAAQLENEHEAYKSCEICASFEWDIEPPFWGLCNFFRGDSVSPSASCKNWKPHCSC